MLSLRCRQRLKLDAETSPLEALGDTPIRAAGWEFAVHWSEGDPVRELRVDDMVLRKDHGRNPAASGSWWFSLPATAHDLTRITAVSHGGETVIGIVNVAGGYQLPETRMGSFIDWFQCFREVWTSFQTEGSIPVVSLVENMATFRTDTTSEIQKLDLPSEYIAKLSSLFDSIVKAPLSRLVSEQCLVDPGEAQRITPATADYFIRHPETWHRKAYVRPRPVKLLDERSIEDYDVYENRFVLHFVEQLDLRVQKIVHHYEDTLEELQIRLPETEHLSNVGLLVESVDLEELRQQERMVMEFLEGLKRFRASLHRVQVTPVLSHVRRLSGVARPNTTLRMHPVYGRLYQLYEELDQARFSHERIRTLEAARSSDLQSLYGDYCLVTALIALADCRFAPSAGEKAVMAPSQGGSGSPGAAGSSDQGLKLVFRHTAQPGVSLTLEYCMPSANPALRQAIRLELRTTGKEGITSTTDVWLIPDTTWWGEPSVSADDKRTELRRTYDRLEELHRAVYPRDKVKQKRRRKRDVATEVTEQRLPGTIVLLHPTPPAKYDDRLGYEHLRLLLTQGDNFSADGDFERFGGYKVGALPLYPGYVDSEGGVAKDRSVLRLNRLIRIHLFRIGVDNICWRCFQPGAVYSSEERGKRFVCGKCGLRWGEVRCKCGAPIVKIMVRRGSQKEIRSVGQVSASPSQSMLISEAVEGRLAVSSVCEAFDQLDGYWAICPNCGHCEKEGTSRACIRCQSRATAQGNERK